MATTYHYKNGSGDQATTYPFTFPYLKEADVKVKVFNTTTDTWDLKTPTTDYIFANATAIQFTVAGNPASGTNNIYIYRDTATDELAATFYPGSAIRSADLNDNYTQNLYTTQESTNTANDAINNSRQVQADGTYKSAWTQADDAKTDAENAVQAAATANQTADSAVQSATTANQTADAAVVTADAVEDTVEAYVADATGLKGDGVSPNPKGVAYAVNQSEAYVADETGLKGDGISPNPQGVAYAVEQANAAFQRDGSTSYTGSSIEFEGATQDGFETTFAITEPTQDATVTLPNITGTLVTTGDTGTVTTTMLDPSAVITNTEQAAGGYAADDTSFFTTAAADARYFNIDDGETVTSTDAFGDSDSAIATTKAINARIVSIVDDVGGFHAINSENVFPNAHIDPNEDAGTIVSIKALSTDLTSDAAGEVTITNGNIAGTEDIEIAFLTPNTTYEAGYGMLVETTADPFVYTFHRLVPKATEVSTVAGQSAQIALLGTADAVADMNTLGTADCVADMNTLGTAAIVEDMNLLGTADCVADMATIADTSGLIADIGTVAANDADISTVAGKITQVETVSDNIDDFGTYADQYQIAASAPSTRVGGAALQEGDQWFDTTTKLLKIRNTTTNAWETAVASNTALVAKSEFTGLGDLLLGTGTSTLTKVGVGSDGTFLKADSNETGGVTWGTVSQTDTTYSMSAEPGAQNDEEIIRLTAGGSGSGTDDIILKAGTGLTIGLDAATQTITFTGQNTYTHPNHTGDVTSSGDGATVIAANAVTEAKIINGAVTSAKLADADLQNLAGCQAGASAALALLTEAEVETLDDLTASTAELNILDGVTADTGELNILDGVTADKDELNLLDGCTASTTQLNYLDINYAGTAQNSKAVVLDALGDVTGLGNIRSSKTGGAIWAQQGEVWDVASRSVRRMKTKTLTQNLAPDAADEASYLIFSPAKDIFLYTGEGWIDGDCFTVINTSTTTQLTIYAWGTFNLRWPAGNATGTRVLAGQTGGAMATIVFEDEDNAWIFGEGIS